MRKKNIEQKYFARLLSVYGGPDQIGWQSLPGKYVTMTTQSNNINVVNTNNEEKGIQDASDKLEKWLKFFHYLESNSSE